MTEVSDKRLYLGNLPRNATKQDVEQHFQKHGTGEITEVKLMSGFGFIEYKDPQDARDVVPAFHGSDFMGERLTVQFARGNRQPREGGGPGNHHGGHHGPGSYGHERAPPRPRRTQFRMNLTGLPDGTSWQDLKDFARQSGLDVVYSESPRNSQGRGFVEFENAADLNTAVEKLDGMEFKGQTVQCVADIQAEMPRGRSRSPGRRGPPPPFDDYDRRGPPRGYSPRRDGGGYGYRERSPRARAYYDDRAPYSRSPPRRPMDDYPPPPPRGRYDDPYRRDYGPPPPPHPADPYANGRPPYDRPPPRDMPPRDFPPRDPGGYPPRDGGYGPPRDDYRGAPGGGGGGGRYW